MGPISLSGKSTGVLMLILVQVVLIQRAHGGESYAIPFSTGFESIILIKVTTQKLEHACKSWGSWILLKIWQLWRVNEFFIFIISEWNFLLLYQGLPDKISNLSMGKYMSVTHIYVSMMYQRDKFFPVFCVFIKTTNQQKWQLVLKMCWIRVPQ